MSPEILSGVELLSSVGFPIFACMYLAKQNKEQAQLHREESKEMREALDGLKTAVNSLISRLELGGVNSEDRE